jgi:membrane-associated phospholipid phosphatase
VVSVDRCRRSRDPKGREIKSLALRALAVAIALIIGAGRARAGQVVMPAELDAVPIDGAAMLLAAARPSTTAAGAEDIRPLPAVDDSTLAGIIRAEAQTHGEPRHSGFKVLVRETGIDFTAFPRRRSTWVLLAIGGAAALATHPADDYVNEHVVGSKTAERIFVAGKWIGSTYVQSGTAIGLYLIGRYALPPSADGSHTNRVSHLGFDLIRAQILSQALVHGIKYSVQRDRPTGECCAFPSGHAATAFAAASVIERHFGVRAAWPTLAVASYVGASRLIDNRHFLSDVMFGAALGMASGWTVVGRHGRSTFALAPTPIRGGMMVSLVKTAGTT